MIGEVEVKRCANVKGKSLKLLVTMQKSADHRGHLVPMTSKLWSLSVLTPNGNQSFLDSKWYCAAVG